MSKTFIRDTFEKVAELGGSTAKKSAKAVAQTFSPIKIIEGVAQKHEPNGQKKEGEKAASEQNHTPLKLEDLEKKYQDQDKQKQEVLKKRLFDLVREGEAQALQEKKQEEHRATQSKEREEEEKEERQKEKRETQAGELPRGKQRRSIFSPKKKAREQHTETRPSVGKS